MTVEFEALEETDMSGSLALPCLRRRSLRLPLAVVILLLLLLLLLLMLRSVRLRATPELFSPKVYDIQLPAKKVLAGREEKYMICSFFFKQIVIVIKTLHIASLQAS